MDKNKMLIDATHPEETRVVALRNGRVEEFDFESAARKLLRGNIYLAKVTRVEPSLQAAFIDYGGNRHGFLAFNEIHPDYYQIPVADRELLKQEEAEAERYAEAEVDERARQRGPRRRRRQRDRGSNGNRGEQQRFDAPNDAPHQDQGPEVDTFEDGYQTSAAPAHDHDEHAAHSHADHPEGHHGHTDHERHAAAPLRQPDHPDDVLRTPASDAPSHYDAPHDHQHEHAAAAPATDDQAHSDWSGHPASEAPGSSEERLPPPGDDQHHYADEADDDGETNGAAEDGEVEQIATDEDALEELPERPRRRARQYKIQEVIKRRQIMLVQVVKEERGNKGAALTTYISLAGRYTVLMPNTARGGGISRKITQPQDRKRLKAIAEELDVEEGMGLIIRTAGAARTKQEIKRDYDYLMRLWESVRELTLSSTAPCLVYEEGNLIKRAIRDLYSKDFDQIVVAGDHAHREAQDFMEMLMPGSGNQVASYRSPEPLFARFGIERQLNALFSPYVTLRSGGYIVINQTEALVSVDVNSGKSTREFSIEETALNTNLEAAEEIARQLKLRDLAGLIVIDFIDMEEKRNNRLVERRLKDALRFDRARIQVGRISHFGLLEMSRQRLRAGVLEGSTSQCPHCQGTGIIRSIESVALAVLRGLEDNLLKQPSSLAACTTAEVALYILNHKRAFIVDMEHRHGVSIRVESSDRMQGANFSIERIAAPVQAKPAPRAAVSMEWGFDREEGSAEASEPDDSGSESLAADDESRPRDGGSDEDRRGRRRRRRRGRRDRDDETREGQAPQSGNGDGRHLDDDGEHHEHRKAPAHGDPGDDADLDDAEAPLEAGDGETEGEGGSHERSDGDGGEPRRRGRRRGRRGGRSRRREGAEGSEVLAGDRHEWGIAEIARPGAEQPESSGAGDYRSSVGLVGSADAGDTGQHRGRRERPSIVEDFDPAAEAIRLAVRLAGGGHRRGRHGRSGEQHSRAHIVESTAAAPAAEPAPPALPSGGLVAPKAAPIKPVAKAPRVVAVETEVTATVSHVEAVVATIGSAGEPQSLWSSSEHAAAPAPVADRAESPAPVDDPARPARRGWWQRRFGGE